MIIREIEIRAFGRLENRKFSFGEGINVIQGENETGKTTLQAFLRAMLFGLERGRGRASKDDAYTRYRPWNSPGAYGGKLELEVGGRRYLLNRDFTTDAKNLTAVDLATGEECPDFEGRVLAPLGLNEGNYRNALWIVQGAAPTGKELADSLGDEMIHMATGGDTGLAASRAVGFLEGKVREMDRRKTGKRLAELEEKRQAMAELAAEAEDLAEELDEVSGRLAESEVALKVGEERGENSIPLGVKLFTTALGCLLLFAVLSQVLPLKTAIGIAVIPFLLMFLLRENGRRRRNQSLEEVRLVREEMQEEKGKLTARKEQAERQLDAGIDLEREYKEVKEAFEQEQQEREALTAAAGLLREVSGQIKSGFGSGFRKELSRAAAELTEGSHEQLYLDEEFHIKLAEDGTVKPLGQFSRGTVEQMNLVLALSAGKLLFREEMPLFLDDALVHYDGSRLRAALEYLSREHPGQIILCSCTEREAECLDDAGIPYRYLTLREELRN